MFHMGLGTQVESGTVMDTLLYYLHSLSIDWRWTKILNLLSMLFMNTTVNTVEPV